MALTLSYRAEKAEGGGSSGLERAEWGATRRGWSLQLEKGAGEIALLRACFHHGGKDRYFYTEGSDGGGLRFVGGVDDESSGELGVKFRDTDGCGRVAELGEHLV